MTKFSFQNLTSKAIKKKQPQIQIHTLGTTVHKLILSSATDMIRVHTCQLAAHSG